MLPVIVIVGRPNVGKSTLFNYLTKRRQALVADHPGVTRDRHYAEITYEDKKALLVDTGGLIDIVEDTLSQEMESQTYKAIEEADLVLFMVDARSGVTPADEILAQKLRKDNKSLILLVNKIDGTLSSISESEFFNLGFSEIKGISAKSGRGIKTLLQELFAHIAAPSTPDSTVDQQIKVAVMGRPNAGKSTLINYLLGEDRMIVSDEPGTTRDSIYIPFQHKDNDYILIDTAGVRRRTAITNSVEKFSVIKSFQAAHAADVVVFMIDSSEGTVSDQDLRLLRLVSEAGAALVVAMNKWDALDREQRTRIKDEIDRRMGFLNFVRFYFIAAKTGMRVNQLYRAINESYAAVHQPLSTGQLTRVLEKAIADHEPPLIKGRRVRLRYAHLGGRHPLTIVVHGKQTEALSDTYKRYLAHAFRRAFSFTGVPLYIKLQTDDNPYINKKKKNSG